MFNQCATYTVSVAGFSFEPQVWLKKHGMAGQPDKSTSHYCFVQVLLVSLSPQQKLCLSICV